MDQLKFDNTIINNEPRSDNRERRRNKLQSSEADQDDAENEG
jgi:hypothetical protein